MSRSLPRFRCLLRALPVALLLGAGFFPAEAAHTSFLRSSLSGKCVDAFGASTADGTDAIQWTCSGGANQSLNFTPTAGLPRVFTVAFAHSGKCLSLGAGGNIEQDSCNGSTSQQFEMRGTPDGDFELVVRSSGQLLSLATPTTGNGVSLIQAPDSDGAHQRWAAASVDLRDPSIYGRWGDLIPWPHIAVSAANLPDGRVLTFSGSERETWPSTEFTYSATWDPTSGQFVEIDHQTHNMFCAHLAMTEDGQVFANGGRNQRNSPWTSLFDYQNNRWTQIQNMTSGGRWYPTTLALTDGDIFTAIGTATNERNPDRFDKLRGWKVLTGIDFQTPVLDYGATHGEHRWWPLLHLAPQGTIFHSGPTPTMGWINPEGNGSYEDTGIRFNSWYHKHGTSIMYDAGKILNAGGWISGGNSASTNQAFTVDLNGATPNVQVTSSMIRARKFHNGVMLPNGEVLVVGGNTSGRKFNDSGTIYSVEFWNPASGNWREGAEMIKPRNYHSVALLLTDGRVLAAGSGYCSGSTYCSGASHMDGQIYEPPYLFDSSGNLAPRPSIVSGPGSVDNASTFDVQTSGAIDYFSMIKMGSTTHGMNTDVRFLPVASQPLGGGVHRLTVHNNPNVLSPGYWMLFAVDTAGVPSVAHVVRVGNLDVRFDNVAPFGSASQSSTWTAPAGIDVSAGQALDGDMTGTEAGSITHTNQDTEAWWELDLHSIYDIDSIRLWNRTDCCQNRLSDFYVLVSDEPFVSTGLAATRAQPGVSEHYVSATVDGQIEVPINRTGQFVRVQLAGTDFLSLAEVQIFGEAPGAGTPGIVHYDYYNGAFTELPDFRSLTPTRSGTVDGFNLSPATDADNFAIRYYGKIQLPTTGTYTFYTTSDDGSRLWIDGQLVVDNDGLHGAQERQGSIALNAGSHDIEVGFFEAGGSASLVVEYAGPGIARQTVPGAVLSLLPEPAGSGEVLREWWSGIGGTSIADLTGNVNYPDNPTGSDNRPSFEGPINWANDYGSRMRGYLYPPFSGDYTFWLASDDNGELWLSTDEDPANVQRIATVPGWSASREWDKFPEQQSVAIRLESGRRYYIEALMKEAGGGDNIAVAWQTPFAPRAVIDGAYLSTPFTTLQILAVGAPPQVSTEPVTIVASAVGDGVTYSWSFGDGTPDTPFSDSAVAVHNYSGPGRYTATLTVRDVYGNEESTTFQQIVHAPLTTGRPNASSSIVFHDGRAEVWSVNPDNDSVAVIDANTDARVALIPVGDDPRTLTVAVDGRVWVANQGDGSLSVIDPATGLVDQTLTLGRGSQPYGVVADRVSPDVWVALEATGEIVRFDAISLTETARASIGGRLRHLSIDANASLLLAPRFVTPPVPGESSTAPNVDAGGGEVVQLDPQSLAVQGVALLEHSERLASEHSGPGLPNYLQAAIVSPDGDNAWVPSKQDNILRGGQRDGFALTHDHTVRAISSRLLLPSGTERFDSRIDHDNASIASAGAFGPYGVFWFTALEGNRQIAISDAFQGSELARFDVGRAPQGLALSPSGNKLYVHNFMDRSVSVIDVSAIFAVGNLLPPTLATISTVDTERLAPQVLRGKQLFYDARDERLAAESYMACASCHNAGGQDGRTWDFTGFGEGLRNTITLEGHGEHGLLHWSGNFDEVQDFENQIRGFAGGTGLMADADFTATEELLGAPKAGLSADLDALAAYIASLNDVAASPHRGTGGALTAAAAAGRDLFASLSCNSCHVGTTMTDSGSGVRHDVGTIRATSGSRMGGTLDGLDTPSLLGVWQTAPYLHDGSAADLEQAIRAHNAHSGLPQSDIDPLVAYLMQVEIGEAVGGCSTDPDADCDGVDDDCDGQIDEDFVEAATSCGVGACAGNVGLETCPPVTIFGANRDGLFTEIDLTGHSDGLLPNMPFGTQGIERDMATGRIYYFEWLNSADQFGYWDPATAQHVIVRTYDAPLGFHVKRMAQAPDGTMFISDNTDTMYTVDLANGDITTFGTLTNVEIGPYGATGDMAFGPDGTLYIANYSEIYSVDMATLSGTVLAADLLSTEGINVFTGLAWCHGQLYAADAQELTARSSIYRYDPASGAFEELWLAGVYVNDLSTCPPTHEPVDSCDPLAGATTEICDGIDNDCDGSTDEGDVCAGGCSSDAECDDGLFCNGAEVCNAGSCEAGTPPSCDDAVGCTTDSCNELADRCDHTPVDSVCDDGLYCNGSETCNVLNDCQAGADPCPEGTCDEAGDTCDLGCQNDAECDDGVFCNGVEVCNAGSCESGTPVSCDDGVGCTTDACNENTDSCDHTPVDSVCDDGQFCNGSETCDAVNDCQAGADPCPGGTCDEGSDSCDLGCQSDAECSDGLFCNGIETCSGGSCLPGADPCPGQTCFEATDTCGGVVPRARMESGTISVGAATVTVSLAQAYADPIVVATPQYANNGVPIVTRVSNVSGNSFDVRLQNPSGNAVVAETVHYLVVEAGAWEVDGLKLEAWRYDSTVTANQANWAAESRSYLQSYGDPVVLGQVMSENDVAWSTFWSQGSSRSAPPTSTVLAVGKHTGEDTTTPRATETVGVIVFDAAHGTLGGVEFETGESADTILGIGNGPPFGVNFFTAFSATPQVAISSMAAMDGNNGGWAVLYGAGPLSAAGMEMAIDEDQVRDTERNHTNEQVHYAVFGAPFVYEEPSECSVDGDCDDGLFCNGLESCAGGTCMPGSNPCSAGDICNEGSDRCDPASATRLETVTVNVGATPTTVSLTQSYTIPVVACTVQAVHNSVPVVTRVSNAAGSSFDLRLQNPSNAAVVAETVHCLVVEQGWHQIGDLTIEAQRFDSTVTDENGSWVGQPATFLGSYSAPVVLGQVMTENDPDWSVFWSRGASRTDPVDATNLFVGKTVCEDTDVTRADETLGLIVIETAHGVADGIEFEAALSLDSVLGVDDAPPYAVDFNGPFATAPAVVLATMSGMDGANGGWAQIHGAAAASTTQLFLSIDEDQILDPERVHISEQVGYLAFATGWSYP